jgi:2-methylcitrate dehydratase PrpD
MENTRRIVEYSCSLAPEDIDREVAADAKLVVLDTLGAMFAAWPTRHPAPRIVGEYVRDMGGRPECTVLGLGFKAPAPNAALVNGVMGYAADIEGGIVTEPPLHNAAVCVPTALVMAERQSANGADLLTAVILGYDVADRVAKANRTPHSYPHSFHPSAVFGTFGAVAIAGRLLGLDEAQFANAYGLAGNIAAGLVAWINDPTEHSRPFGIGVAARNGVMTALLASKGFGGPEAVFDARKYNIFDAYSGAMDLSQITRGLGTDFAVSRHEGFKKYPCCNDIHSGLDALLKILAEHGLETNEIASITHLVKEDRRPIIDRNPLKSHNAQYIMAVAAAERKVLWDDFLKDRRDEPAIGEIFEHTQLVGAEELADSPHHAPAIVEVRTRDGRSFREQVDMARGHRLNPMSRNELESKFFGFAVPIVGEARAKAIVDLVNDLESVDSARELIRLVDPQE